MYRRVGERERETPASSPDDTHPHSQTLRRRITFLFLMTSGDAEVSGYYYYYYYYDYYYDDVGGE